MLDFPAPVDPRAAALRVPGMEYYFPAEPAPVPQPVPAAASRREIRVLTQMFAYWTEA